ncbi:MAG: hypothetical protein PHY54_11770 [Methylococcales bacterium]|nr:hypothetical protein [Methylococcales bacterium]
MSNCINPPLHKTVPLNPQDAWDLMWRSDSQLHFLGRQAHIELKAGAFLHLSDETLDWWRTAHIKHTSRIKRKPQSLSITLLIDRPLSWPQGDQSQAIIRITGDKNNESLSHISIEEWDIPSQYLEEVQNYWHRCLHSFCKLANKVNKRRKQVRQAVVVIHGIGEQWPGETLDSLANSGVFNDKNKKDDRHPDSWVKPDDYSDSYELRMVKFKGTNEKPTTDVYEFYWANIIRDTTLNQISSWLFSLLFRRPTSVPCKLFPIWLFTWLMILIAIGVTVAHFAGIEIVRWNAMSSWAGLALLVSLLWGFFKGLVTSYIGDAARYLRPHPTNIAHRHTIRQAGVNFIENLHNSGKYDRIVLVGHSLGSVIAYDIITYAWMRMHDKHQQPSKPMFKNIIKVEKSASLSDDKMDINDFQDKQFAAWCQQRVNSQPWLITDLVTLGSPLTYAKFLITANETSFNKLKENRTLPTCPPQTEETGKTKGTRMTYELNYKDMLSKKNRTFVVFNHGAPFGVTRWTNLYFKSGDIIGGSIKEEQLGKGVKNVPLDSPWKVFSHTSYWKKKGNNKLLQALKKVLCLDYKECENRHIDEFHDALYLNSRDDLVKLLKNIPAFALLHKSAMSRNI